MTTDWERLEKVIEASGLTVNKFASVIGLKRAENLYRIKNNKNAISKDLAEMITTKYCNISKSWLLTGEGFMYVDELSERSSSLPAMNKIPYFEIIPSYNDKTEISSLKPSYYIDVPRFYNCDIAALFVGESMTPKIVSGSIIALKEISLTIILPGEMYLVMTDDYVTVKYLRTVDGDDNKLKLVPENTEFYDSMVLDKKEIRRLFLIKGVISTEVL